MRKVMPIRLKFFYLDKPESPDRLKTAYSRIFEIAKQNILERRRMEGKEVVLMRLVSDLMIDFLHDVIAVNVTVGNEVDLKEEDYRKLAELYAKYIVKKSLNMGNEEVSIVNDHY